MVQIFSLVIAMSTDIALSFDLVRAIVFFWWVLLVAIVLLLLKGRTSHNSFLIQHGIGLILILSTTFSSITRTTFYWERRTCSSSRTPQEVRWSTKATFEVTARESPGSC